MSTLFGAKKTLDFSKFMVCPHGQEGRGLRQCEQGGQFFSILCGRFFWTGLKNKN